MRVRFWGTRGSLAKPGPTTLRYGGNTSCVEVVSAAGTRLILDCGTGSHDLGARLQREAAGAPIKGHILISHTHWDHIQGIPFFAPLFVPGNEWDFYAPQGFGESLKDTLAGQMEYTYFPVTPDAFGADIRYHHLSEGSFRIEDISIRTRFLNHPALTLAYRIEVDGAAMVYACDHEPHCRALAFAEGPLEGQDLAHAEFLRDADLVIHDAQYIAEEYGPKAGWGHSTHEYAVRVAQEVGVKRLALSHHDPLRTDDQLDALIAEAKAKLNGSGLDLFGAAEGLELVLEKAGAEAPVQRNDQLAMSGLRSDTDKLLLLVATGDSGMSAKVLEAVTTEPVQVISATTGASALKLFEAEQPSLVILDDTLADEPARSVSEKIRALAGADGELPIMMVGHNGQSSAGAGPSTEWLQAPFSTEFARARIRTWLMRGQFRWVRAKIGEDEASRIHALHNLNLLDTEPEERFDRYTRLAAALFDVPVALVTLVDEDRQWFKSCIGSELSETSREVSFCAHAIECRDVLVVPDALSDPRFADNPLVIGGPRIRFYAGAPLFLPGGHCVGTLCIIDRRPRQLTREELGLLDDLRDLVEKELVAGARASG
jgi:phosphoribosyl 1,2-cyclic phosphodiesterase/CheY-like chemotaxis protein